MSDSPRISDLRVNYEGETLEISDLDPAPLVQFTRWFDDVLAAKLPEPNAMVVATADRTGRPSARHVLLKQADERGFVFYTNYESKKGSDIAENPQASLVFPWFAMYRQVTVMGRVERVSREESAEYFATRPHGSRIGALVSHQSEVITSRQELDDRWQKLATEYPEEVPLPDHWGGFVVIPESIEFWAGRRSRLHDRLRYRRLNHSATMADPAGWEIERLSP